ISYYARNPKALKNDKFLFQTWYSALDIAQKSQSRLNDVQAWKASRDLAWIPVSERIDAWGHNFCVRADMERSVVVSPGRNAAASFDCSTLELPDDVLANLPLGRLHSLSSGALLLVLKSKPGS